MCPHVLMNDTLYHALAELYGHEWANSIASTVQKEIDTVEPIKMPYQNPLWYKYLNLYIVYPDVLSRRHVRPLQSLKDHLDVVTELGCNAMHILPFLDSPMIDKGFDIRDYCTIRPELGTMHDMQALIYRAEELGIRIFMDLVFNHVSDQHTWFRRAQQGDTYYREYFIYARHKPQYIRSFHKDSAVWAEYRVEGKKKAVCVAFPELSEEMPLWRQGSDGYWYYHTYYPQEPDINWFNPHVFLEYAHILIYWTRRGFNFRLDAIPFVGQHAYKDAHKDNHQTHAIVMALREIANMINPETTFIVESYEKLQSVIKYFGSSNESRAHLSYNFHLCTHTWITIINRDSTYLWNKVQETSLKPKHAEWINFLRNHDELSLAYIPEQLQAEVRGKIGKYGVPFREGHGISGRTFSLLSGNERRFIMAYMLLASLPGGLGIVYGDEYGMTNIPSEKLSKSEQADSRNVNRGKLSGRLMNSDKAKRIHQSIANILHERNILREYMNVFPQEVELDRSDKELWCAVYVLGISRLYVFINLSGRRKVVTVKVYGARTVLAINGARASQSGIHLGPYGGIWLQV